MKILFLDFDGVLNDSEHRRNFGNIFAGIDKSRMPLLKDLIDSTGAKIVLITSLREYWNKNPDRCDYYGETINQVFAEYGLEVYDKTPVLEGDSRANEILDWIYNNPGFENFVVIDDGDLGTSFLYKNFVQPRDGLEEEHVKKAVEILNNK